MTSKVVRPDKLRRPADPLPPQTYAVTYAIIKKGTAPLSIPFFSKVSLTNAVTTLRALGYTPQLTKINITPQTSSDRCQRTAEARLEQYDS